MNWLSLTTLMGVLACLWLVMSYNDAHAQQRATCSEARFSCGRQRVCEQRYRDCLQTGCLDGIAGATMRVSEAMRVRPCSPAPMRSSNEGSDAYFPDRVMFQAN
jgi:hypothetical protein